MSLPPEVGMLIESHLNDIAKLFKPGVKITLMVRTPGHPARDLLMTIDDYESISAMLDRRMKPKTYSSLPQEGGEA